MTWKTVLAVGLTIILVMVAFVIILPYIWPLPWGRPPSVGAPAWSFEGWWQFNQTVDTAVVGKPVTLKLEVVGQVITIGSFGIEIKKDIPFAADVTVHTDAKALSLIAGQTVIVETTFTPDTPTGIGVREYFFKLYWNDIPIYDPTTPGQRFGLKVTEASIVYQGGEFEGG